MRHRLASFSSACRRCPKANVAGVSPFRSSPAGSDGYDRGELTRLRAVI
ncbi:hypothetical protein HMPREF0185_00066 [Brevundimonas diminuta 470-4]|nr:hypothetical protein HMPREF0185_00066 [Brevundimonas diminuta 470-4]